MTVGITVEASTHGESAGRRERRNSHGRNRREGENGIPSEHSISPAW
jgi:hypothetical protein